ncbi:ammonium transporter [Pelagibius sp.]|uniref:ammonium transporter n=1 Tax=Pelagibius sp. TaxID=1931238 RepID=UPI00261B8DAB|nr:ammonium transporter [Pelagibius sp.]
MTHLLKDLRSRARRLALVTPCATLIAVALPASAEAAVSAETSFVFNTFSLLVHGFLVLWMAAGFASLESGLVRTKSVTTILLKNITLFAIAGLSFYLTGYNLMFDGVDGGFIGSLGPWRADDSAALAGDFSAGYSASSDWFFQMVFVATAASIVSGTLAERIKLWPFFAFVCFLTAVMYPIQGAWIWGGGFLAELGFADFAGGTVVHSVGGWSALTGAILLGARRGKYGVDGKAQRIPASSLPLATLGTFILWLGWLGFNGGSHHALGSAADAIVVSNIYVNTTMSSAGGLLAAVILTQLISKRIDLTIALNGALGGLVSITAGPNTPEVGQAILIGAVGGSLVVLVTPLLDRWKIDDVVGAIPVHLVAGTWGTLAVAFTNPAASLPIQLLGIGTVAAFVITASSLAWLLLKATVGLRLSQAEEALGIDKVELGTLAYPEFRLAKQI